MKQPDLDDDYSIQYVLEFQWMKEHWPNVVTVSLQYRYSFTTKEK